MMPYKEERPTSERLARPRTSMAELAKVAANIERLYPGSYIEQDVNAQGETFFYLHCPDSNAGGTGNRLDDVLMVLGKLAVENATEPGTLPPHPRQPVVLRHGVARFRENAIVRHLVDHGGIDLNRVAVLDFSDEDRAHFEQLIGRSVSAWGCLEYVDQDEADAAQAEAMALVDERGR